MRRGDRQKIGLYANKQHALANAGERTGDSDRPEIRRQGDGGDAGTCKQQTDIHERPRADALCNISCRYQCQRKCGVEAEKRRCRIGLRNAAGGRGLFYILRQERIGHVFGQNSEEEDRLDKVQQPIAFAS